MPTQGPDLKDLFDQIKREAGSGSGGRPGTSASFVDNLAKWSRRALVIAAVVLVVALVVCYWWFHPALNLGSTRVWMWICGICLVVILALAVAAARSIKRAPVLKKLMLLPGAVIAAFLVGLLLSQPFVPGNAERYATVLQTTDGDFATDIQQVDYADVPVIDRDSAILLQPCHGFHPRVCEPVRDRGHLQPDQLPGSARAREPAGIRRPLQVVLQP